jgi:hypothetical protein
MKGEMMRPRALNPINRTRLKPGRGHGSSRFCRVARRVSAVALTLFVLWGGGFGCLWCCASDLPKGCCDKRGAAMVHKARQSCAAHRRCCESTESNQGAAIKEPSQTAAAHCCLIGAQSNGPAALPQSFNQAALAVTPGNRPAPGALRPQAPRTVAHAPPANKGSTHLRCCVLLI